jgi:uncharacterized protein (TIGR02145 family)
MKKIISCLAIAVMLYACSKEESTVPSNQESSLRKGGASSVTTKEASYILPFGATSGGSVSKSGGGNNTTERGVCYSTSPNPTIVDDKVTSGSSSGTFICILSGLVGNTTYYARAYATNSTKGTTTYGNDVSFTTSLPIYSTVTDIDGNIYTTIEIGTQVWMMENLKTSKYRDGTLIPNVTDDVLWAGLSDGAYSNYNNDVANVITYGRLYNGYAVDDSRNIAPEGWHVATGDEVQALLDHVGEAAKWAPKLKEAGTTHWNDPNTGADNSSGFTALPGGFRMEYVNTETFEFNTLRDQGRWWASDPSGAGSLDYFYMSHSAINVLGSLTGDSYPPWPINYEPFDKRNGYSVRCVKD